MLVVRDKEDWTVRKMKERSSPPFDVRAVVDRDSFSEEAKLLSYFNWRLAWGENMDDKLPIFSKKENLAKLGFMFFYGFLRNYLVLEKVKNKDRRFVKNVLTNAGEWEYVRAWLDVLPEEMVPFIEKIRSARKRFPDISVEETNVLLEECVEMSWKLISILDGKLSDAYVHERSRSMIFKPHPTIFSSSSVAVCRQKTECLPSFTKRTRLLYLPAGFQFIFSKDQFVKDYFLRVIDAHPANPIKYAVKNFLAIFEYFFCGS